MNEYGRIISGAQSCRCTVRECGRFVEIRHAEECPEGFLPIDKILPKPEETEGKVLAFTYTNEADRLTKEYFLVDEGKSFLPRKFSKLSIYAAVTSINSNSPSDWSKIQAWLEGKTINGINGWLAFNLAQEISEDHPLFTSLAEEARQLLGLSPEQFETMLEACVLK